MSLTQTSSDLLERMFGPVEDVKRRLARAVDALEAAQVAYAVIGGNAVAAWVTTIDWRAVRFTVDVDLLLRRDDLAQAIEAMQAAGFVYRHAAGVSMFLDGPDGQFRDAVHVIFANEKVRPTYAAPAPDVSQIQRLKDHNILSLDSLVRMKLTSYRRKDQTHLVDMINLGLIDATWLDRLDEPFRSRLQELIDDPNERELGE